MNNTHELRCTMVPDENFNKNLEVAEKERLKKI